MKKKILVVFLSIIIALWVLSSGYGAWEKELSTTINITIDNGGGGNSGESGF